MPLPDDPGRLQGVASSFQGLAHPTRLQILEALKHEPQLSPSQLVVRIRPAANLANVAYHTRALAGAGLLRPAGRRPVRGALEHFYRLTPDGQELIELVDRLSACAPEG
jgi:DNA-binding transcriptional ArsR family regulator